MENRIRQYIESIFASAPGTAKAYEVREEMIVNVIERYHDLVAQGMGEDEAYRAAVGGIGDVSELIETLKREAGANAAPQQPIYQQPVYQQPVYQQKKMGAGGVVAIIIASVLAFILLLVLIGGIIAIRVTGNVFSGDGVLANVFHWAVDNASSVTADFSFDDDSGFTSDYSETNSYSVPVDGLDSLTIYWISGNVKVLPAEAGATGISFAESCSLQALDDGNALRYKVSDGELTIRYCTADLWKRINWSNLSSSIPNKELTVYVPADMLTNLTVDGVSNGLSMSDIKADFLNIHNVSGDVRLERVSAAGMRAESVSGDITLANCTGGELDCETVSGAASIEAVFNKYDVNTVSGNVSISFTGVPMEVDIETVSGSVELSGCTSFGFTLDFDSASGDIVSKLDLKADGKRFAYGDGHVMIDVDTVSGDVLLSE